MFGDASFESVGYTSSWSTVKELQDKESQTTDLPVTDKDSQSTYKVEDEVQTETQEQHKNPQYNEQKLASFLKSIVPSVMDELDKIERSKAFNSYMVANDDSEDDTEELYKLVYNDKKLQEDEESKSVTSLAWSCTGNVIVVGFGLSYHLDWCSHNSSVHFYNISKPRFDGATPEKIINTTSCVTSVTMHPYEPSVVAIGTHSGEILVWNLQKEGTDVYIENNVFHKDCVTQLSWVNINSNIMLASSSIDGHMFLFQVSPRIGSVILKDRFVLFDNIEKPRPGITCFSFSPSQDGVFVAGVEGGGLAHCSVASAVNTSRPGSSVILKDPILRTLNTLSGPVTCITFSPHTDHIFATATAEQKFTIHTLNDMAPLHVLWVNFDVIGLEWNPSQANTILVWGSASKVLVYDTHRGRHLHTLKPKEDWDVTLPISVIMYNSKSPKLLALGTGDGDTYIWDVPSFFKIK